MIRSLVAGFGAATMLAAAGSMTPVGQAVLGVKHAAAAPSTAAVVRHAAPAAVRQAKPAGKRAVTAKPSSRARSQVRRAAAAPGPQAASTPSVLSALPAVTQFLPLLLQSQTAPVASPLAGIMGGGSSLPDMLQQLANPAPAPAPAAAPEAVQLPAPAVPAQSQPAPVSGDVRADQH